MRTVEPVRVVVFALAESGRFTGHTRGSEKILCLEQYPWDELLLVGQQGEAVNGNTSRFYKNTTLTALFTSLQW